MTMAMGRYYAKLAIPNQEVKIVYQQMFRNWLYQAAPERAYVDDLVKAMFSGDAETMQEILEEMFLRVLSYQDGDGRKPEKLYHGFVLGLLVHLEGAYDVRSNRESGRGRADVLIRPRQTGQPGVVMEFKVRKPRESTEQALRKAAEQVRDRKYAEEVRVAGASPVYEYAMVFDGKQAWVQRVEELLNT
ncbi:MAG TPA: PD-(D/E)XK nuclease domain-containing protein, partial [Polyangium sp.]|nr:PD-(D/E)XK nuclease domain-containing protein [Polyangium sp.]